MMIDGSAVYGSNVLADASPLSGGRLRDDDVTHGGRDRVAVENTAP